MPKQGPPPGAHLTYSSQFRRCKKPDCPSCGIGGAGHGPYWYAYWREDGRQRSSYLGKQAPPGAEAQLVSAPARETIPTLRVQTFGGLAIRRGATALPISEWRPRSAALLLAVLVSAPRQRLHRDALADLLWPESGPGAGQQNLRATIHHLRRLLEGDNAGRGYLHHDGAFLCLMPAPRGHAAGDWLDADTFARQAARALAGHEAAACRAALTLYGGEYLPEYIGEEWATAPRDALRQQYLDLLLHLAVLAERDGALEEATDALRRALAADPCLEQAARALIRVLTARGQHAEAVRTYRQLATSMRIDLDLAPDRETEAEYRAALESRARASRARTNLPAALTSFVGRETELAALGQLLGADDARETPEARLVTVVGAGGCGKSRLAIEAGHALVSYYPDGVWLVELALLTPERNADLEQVVRHTCSVLGIQETAGTPLLTQLLLYLAARRALLILDNCEHVLGGCVGLVTTLLQRCPDVRMLATSRATLQVQGEHRFAVQPFAVPEPALPLDTLRRSAALQLFTQRARAVQPNFTLTEATAPHVAGICRRLDGLPLALEIAAARIKLLPPALLLDRLDQGLRVLGGGRQDLPARQRTLQGTIAWSEALLGDAERRMFRRLGVFAGGASLEGVAAVCAEDDEETNEVLDRLGTLVDQSLVHMEQWDTAAPRYRMLETIREYALNRLELSGEAGTAHTRHAAHYLALAERAEPELSGASQLRWLDLLEDERPNLRAAIRWSIEHDRTLGLSLATALCRFWEVRGPLSEGWHWLEELVGGVETAAPLAVRARALTAGGRLAQRLGDYAGAAAWHAESAMHWRALDNPAGLATALHNQAIVLQDQAHYDGAIALYQESLRLKETGEDRVGIAASLHNLGLIARDQGDYQHAATLLGESLAIERELANGGGIANSLYELGNVARYQHDYERAHTLLEESLSIERVMGNKLNMATVLHVLGDVARDQGQAERARDLYSQSLALSHAVGDKFYLVACAESLAILAATQGWLEPAARLLGGAAALRDDLGTPVPPHEQATYRRIVAGIQAAIGDQQFAAAQAVGRAQPLYELVAELLRDWGRQ